MLDRLLHWLAPPPPPIPVRTPQVILDARAREEERRHREVMEEQARAREITEELAAVLAAYRGGNDAR